MQDNRVTFTCVAQLRIKQMTFAPPTLVVSALCQLRLVCPPTACVASPSGQTESFEENAARRGYRCG
ncbi:hypothetical protein EVAR_70047_1 [Eumeta japonica]|uniref:Uncharacterized protein n=1 Tax=Eumeta variegata TaxID=151549 RepID=A0A4C2AEE7_EUMVA|nr:hypothetical protein EVAR_70047_1 [Eumeta japonica]